MEGIQERLGSGPQNHRAVECVPSKPAGLCALLQEEWFLLMIFERLVDYGLQECRLVCRNWRDACKQFPVKIEIITPEQLERSTTAFPKATSISVVGQDHQPTDDEFFEWLTSFTNLQTLHLHSDFIRMTMNLQPHFQSMPQLTELALVYCSKDKIDDLIESLRYLTNLTRLVVLGYAMAGLTKKPFTELRKIRELKIPINQFCNERDECLFPSLTNLTRLDLVNFVGLSESHLEVGLYASSLQSLAIPLRLARKADFVALTSLTGLTTLETSAFCTQVVEFLEMLTKLRSILRFCISSDGEMGTALCLAISALPELKALEAPDVLVHSVGGQIPLASELTRLTELRIKVDGELVGELSCLVLLEHLSLNVSNERHCSLNGALMGLSNLQTLAIKFQDPDCGLPRRQCPITLTLSGSALRGMCFLKSLLLEDVKVDGVFFQELASKPQLTKLEFNARIRAFPRFISQVNLMTQLEELTLWRFRCSRISELLLPEYLPKLKTVNVSGLEHQILELRQRFNWCGHKATINRKESAWCSRSAL